MDFLEIVACLDDNFIDTVALLINARLPIDILATVIGTTRLTTSQRS